MQARFQPIDLTGCARMWLHRFLICCLGAGLAFGAAAQTANPEQSPVASVCQTPVAVPAPDLNRHARQLAGLAGDDDLAAVAAHAVELQRAFARLEAGQFLRIRDWSAQVLPSAVHTAEVVYYPFSGPDVLYPAALFPAAKRLLFTGLEPVGAAPVDADFDSPALANSLGELRHSLATLLGQSFFVTAKMQQQFARNRFRGVTPILLLLLARSGFEIDSATGVRLDAEGKLCARDFTERVDQAGVEIRYRRPGEADLRSLVYLRVDVSNDGLKAAPGYALYVRQFGVTASYLKSASYLMYTPGFSAIRDLLLAVSPALLQDDSGIPFRAFPAATWQPVLYGHYQRAAEGFGGHTQADLREAFTAAPPSPLPFWIGYRHNKADSNLQLYLRRPAAP